MWVMQAILSVGNVRYERVLGLSPSGTWIFGINGWHFEILCEEYSLFLKEHFGRGFQQ